MPTPEKDFPYTLEEWHKASANDHYEWLLHLANEYLYAADDGAYKYLTDLASQIQNGQWVKFVKAGSEESEVIGNAVIGVLELDGNAVDIRTIALELAVSATNGTSTSIPRTVEIAKEFERYLFGFGSK